MGSVQLLQEALIRGWYSSTVSWRETYYSYTQSTNSNSNLFAMSVMSSSLNVEFDELHRSIFISNPSITADPDLDVISCGRRQLYIEPWW